MCSSDLRRFDHLGENRIALRPWLGVSGHRQHTKLGIHAVIFRQGELGDHTLDQSIQVLRQRFDLSVDGHGAGLFDRVSLNEVLNRGAGWDGKRCPLRLGRQTQHASTDADEKVNTKAKKAMGDGLGGSHGCQTKQVSRKFSLVKTIDRAKMSG